MRWRRRAALVAAGLGGVVVGAVAAFAITDLAASRDQVEAVGPDGGDQSRTHRSAHRPSTTTSATLARGEAGSGTLLAWTSGGLPAGFVDAVAATDLVLTHTVVSGDQVDLIRSTTQRGVELDVATPGWAIPLDALAIDPRSFAAFADPRDRETIEGLEPGGALLTEASAGLRRLGPGDTIELRTGSVSIAGVIGDVSGAGAELILHRDDAPRLDAATERYVLVTHRDDDRDDLARTLADLAAPHPVRLRSPAETTWLRHGDAVVPPVFVKTAFGEFEYRDRGGRDVELDPGWVDAHIVVAEVPILGRIRCHRMMVEPFRMVLAELERMNLAHLIDPGGYAGCWVPRRIAVDQPLSRHAWGIAVDLNIGANPRGSFSTQDPLLIDLMRTAGFVWGGSWLVPDPGHYELEPARTTAERVP